MPFLQSSILMAAAAGATMAAGNGATYNAIPLRAVFNEDARVIWFGDSFSIGATWRVSGGSLLTWPFTSDMVGATTGENRGTAVVFSTELDKRIGKLPADPLWRLYLTGPDAGLDVRFALPTWDGREFYADGLTNIVTTLVEYQGRTLLNGGSLGQFNQPGELLRVRPMFLQAQGGIAATPRIYRAGAESITIDPAALPAPAGQIGTSPAVLSMTANASGIYEFTLGAPEGPTSGYVHTNGFTIWEVDEQGDRKPGMAWSYLAGGSWRYEDFGRDVPAQPGVFSKTFSREQLEYWFRATTIDTNRPVFVFYYFDTEATPFEESRDHIRSMIEQTEGAGLDAGIGPIHHCFVVPHMHTVSGLGLDPAQIGLIQSAAVAVAKERTDMSVISIFDAMDGILLNGSPEAQTWLADQGHDMFVYGDRTYDYLQPGVDGDLLDAGELHPEPSVNGSYLFSWYAAQAIIAACPADFAAPYGVLDLADINKFVTLFLDDAFAADLAPPQGFLDLADLTAFIQSFLAGCDSGG